MSLKVYVRRGSGFPARRPLSEKKNTSRTEWDCKWTRRLMAGEAEKSSSLPFVSEMKSPSHLLKGHKAKKKEPCSEGNFGMTTLRAKWGPQIMSLKWNGSYESPIHQADLVSLWWRVLQVERNIARGEMDSCFWPESYSNKVSCYGILWGNERKWEGWKIGRVLSVKGLISLKKK